MFQPRMEPERRPSKWLENLATKPENHWAGAAEKCSAGSEPAWQKSSRDAEALDSSVKDSPDWSVFRCAVRIVGEPERRWRLRSGRQQDGESESRAESRNRAVRGKRTVQAGIIAWAKSYWIRRVYRIVNKYSRRRGRKGCAASWPSK